MDKKMVEKYNSVSLDEFYAMHQDANKISVEKLYYEIFLNNTDYIASKLAEGVATKEDYAEELEAREFARSEIRRLENI